jgi:hypothetical protein
MGDIIASETSNYAGVFQHNMPIAELQFDFPLDAIHIVKAGPDETFI